MACPYTEAQLNIAIDICGTLAMELKTAQPKASNTIHALDEACMSIPRTPEQWLEEVKPRT